MNFECPAWLQTWLGVGPGSADESVVGRIEMLRPLSSTLTLVLALFAIAAVVYCYARASEAGRAYRVGMALLRLVVIAVLTPCWES